MIAGHLGVALGARALGPKAPFVWLLAASIAVAIGLVVLAHVPADWLTGEKALWLHGPVVGLYLYRWPAVDFVLELPR